MSRQIFLDTETTGLSPKQGHRVIEIGCVEMIDRELTGEHYHVFTHPDREIDPGAQRVHGITLDFLSDKPRFSEIKEEFLAFIEGAEIIIHNAPFDVGFIEHELSLCKHKWTNFWDRFAVTDTLAIAKKKHPGQRNNLDALCRRYEIDNSHRTLHGALLDSEILAEVYLRMTGGQSVMAFGQEEKTIKQQSAATNTPNNLPLIQPTAEEAVAHEKYLEALGGVTWA